MAISITIGKLPGVMQTVAAEEPVTVRDAAALAQINDLSGYSVRVDGAASTLDNVLNQNCTVLFVKNNKGNA